MVLGKHSPNWAPQHSPEVAAAGSTLTYERSAPMAENLVGLLCGMWPLLAVTVMGIALLWSGTIYGTP